MWCLRKQKQLLLKIGNKTLVAFLGPSQRNFNVTGEKNSRNSVIKKNLKMALLFLEKLQEQMLEVATSQNIMGLTSKPVIFVS